MNVRFSFIVPVFNVEAYLPKCLESLDAQEGAEYEVVCIDDGSTDGSSKILDQWRQRMPRLQVVRRENGGLSAARNTGLDIVQGDYVIFVDSDDWVEPHMLSVLQKTISGEDMVCFGCRTTAGANNDLPLNSEVTTGWDYYNRHALEPREIPFVCVWQRCYRRQFLKEEGLRFCEGILHEDNEFTPRACLAAKRVKVIGDVLYNYRVRPASIMTSRGLHSKESLVLIANRLSELFRKQGGIETTTVFKALTQSYQMAFVGNNGEEDRQLLPLVDWNGYLSVSHTSLRHRVQYRALRLSPRLFRLIYQFLSHFN